MRRTIHIWAIAALSMMLLTLPAWSQQTRQLVILHTSDTHSHVDPIDENSADRNAGWGGVVRRAALVRQERQTAETFLLLNCGDISQGTPYYNMFQGEVEMKSMNLMGYDAMTIGNHEFDYGLDNMLRLFTMADFPVVCANYDFTGTVLEKVVKPYAVLKRGGMRIGVFGLSPQLEGLVQKTKCEGVKMKDTVESAREAIAALEKKHCDMIIMLSHLGVDPNLKEPGEWDHTVVPQIQGVDLVLGGHTHTFLSHPVMVKDQTGKEIPVMHIGGNGVYMSKTVVELETKK